MKRGKGGATVIVTTLAVPFDLYTLGRELLSSTDCIVLVLKILENSYVCVLFQPFFGFNLLKQLKELSGYR